MMERYFDQPILLISCPFGHLESPYLGLARVASFLKGIGIKSDVLDLNIKLYHFLQSPEHWANIYLYTEKQKFQKNYHLFSEFVQTRVNWLIRSPYRLFGFTVHRYNILFVNDLAEKLDRMLDCKIIIGGPSIQIDSEKQSIYNSDNVVFVKGQGERVLPHLFRDYKHHRLKREYVDSDYPKYTVSFNTTFDEYDLDSYLIKCLPVILNTGCIGNCVFCDDRYYNHPQIGDVIRVCSEITSYTRTKGVNKFEFCDPAINMFPKTLTGLCNSFIQRGFNIQWNSNAIPNRYFTHSNCLLLKQSGCKFLRFGIESGSPSILKKMRKQFSTNEAETALKNCVNEGIDTHINLIVGFPGESQHEFQETLNFVVRNKRYITRVDNIFTCYITPRSELERFPDKYGIILPEEKHWRCWYSMDGTNTYKMRKTRSDILVNILKQEGIEFGIPDV